MKTLIAATLLAAAISTPSSAANWFNADGTPSAAAAAVVANPPCVGCVPFRDLRGPDSEIRSRTVIRTNYGTTVINGTYRMYSR